MPDLLLVLLFFLVALFYSSIGFGGGSSYLALLSLFFVDFYLIRTIALLCNVAVVSGNVIVFYRRGLLDLKKSLPIVLISMPAALIGTQFRLSQQIFFIILGIALIFSALMMLIKSIKQHKQASQKKYAKGMIYGLSGGVGILSGLVGIGGGIFLSPILNLMQWDNPKKIAALASFFILANSLAGLGGLAFRGDLILDYGLLPYLVLAVVAGGQLGSWLTITFFNPQVIKVLTAILVLYVGLRLVLWHSFALNI